MVQEGFDGVSRCVCVLHCIEPDRDILAGFWFWMREEGGKW